MQAENVRSMLTTLGMEPLVQCSTSLDIKLTGVGGLKGGYPPDRDLFRRCKNAQKVIELQI